VNDESRKSGVSRREFCQTVATTAAVISVPLIVPARVFGAEAPSNRLRIAQIGCGRIAREHDMPGVLKSGLADIVAVCDLDSKRVSEGKQRVEQWYREANRALPAITTHEDYHELAGRKDIDAFVISTPDHQHAQVALTAVLAGKDVYLQKPFTMTHAEGVILRDVVAKSGRILQVGSQQRSTNQFRFACELVRSGRIGQVQRVEIGLPIDPTKPDDPPQPVPSNLNYDRWLGPTPEVYYTEQRVHPQQDYSRPGWLRNEAYCLGMITGWGSHHYDILHWALDCEHGGPSRVQGHAQFPTNKIWNVHGAYDINLTYPKNVQVNVSDKNPNGLKFIGTEGWVWVTREGQATASDPTSPGKPLPPLDASDQKILDPNGVKVQLPRSDEHHKNWLECVRSRQTPIAPAPIAHRATAACIVSWIAMKLGRPLVWDAQAEHFVNDDEANAMLSRPERAPYGATRLIHKA
jgi:myo-inositol 2-dehydrogenase / D-chiro-inositol 1-dehydrogenase